MTALLAWALHKARQQTLTLVADIPQERVCLQSMPSEHHPSWILGHLLLGDSYLIFLLGLRDLPSDFQPLLAKCGPGAAPTPSLDHYEAKQTLIDRVSSTGSLRLTAVRKMTVDDLARATPDAMLAQARPTIGHHLQTLVCYEGYHGGQLAAWRRAHGLTSAR
jgi:hypothetical protein